MSNQSPTVRYFAHRTESRYLCIAPAGTTLLVIEQKGASFSVKAIQNPQISKVEKELLYNEIPYCEYCDAMRQVHNQLFNIEFGHGLEKCAKS